MIVNGKHYRTIREIPGTNPSVEIIDQRLLPFEFTTVMLSEPTDFLFAIKEMQVRGAPLIGVTAAYGLYCAAVVAPADNFDKFINSFAQELINTRPTAINLSWAIKKSLEEMKKFESRNDKILSLLETARNIAEEDVSNCKKIGIHGSKLIKEISGKKLGNTVNILTHCNAGWLAAVDYGTATAPIYNAFDSGVDIHVWVDETRPRNQGSRLTAWELGSHGIPNTIIVDNAGGYLMQNGMVDIVIVGSDRTISNGYVVNKTGTYLKALAARDNNIPFYAALPISTFDFSVDNINEVLIEQRYEDEVLYTEGFYEGKSIAARTSAFNAKAANYAFDITPPELVTGLITEKGIIKPDKENIKLLIDR
jgi:methylthioribose-1-phosphate isomerase